LYERVPKTLNEDKKKLARKKVCFETPRNKALIHEVENSSTSETKVSLIVELQMVSSAVRPIIRGCVCTTKSDSGPVNPHTSFNSILRNDLDKGSDLVACALVYTAMLVCQFLPHEQIRMPECSQCSPHLVLCNFFIFFQN
jgi:hypothetical protein